MAIFSPFRFLGDLLHVASIFLLLIQIRQSKSCHGISLKSQILYMVVFITRYLDVIFSFREHFASLLGLYNLLMKILFVSSSVYIVYLMRVTYNKTYDKSHDSFRVLFLVAPCVVLALLINHGYRPLELLWTFSIYLEAVAIVPQLFLLQRTREIETMRTSFIICMGGYRAMYLLNWIWRAMFEPNYRQWIVWLAGLVQTGLYADFFYYYYKSWLAGGRFSLPSTVVPR